MAITSNSILPLKAKPTCSVLTDLIQTQLRCADPTTKKAFHFHIILPVTCYKGMVMHNGSGETKKTYLSDDFYIIKRDLTENYLLPGSGRKPITCSGVFPVGFCPSCGRIKLVSGNCGCAECPDCSVSWRYKRTKKIFERLFSYKITKKTRLIHAVVSLPQEEIDQLKTKEDIDELRSIVYRYCETKGFDGGLVIFHPWRLIKEKKKELRNIASGLDEWAPGEFGLWKTLIKLENWRDFVYFSPHFHIIGAASWLVPTFKGEGWIFKRIGDLSAPLDVVKCSMYLLSHLGVTVGYNAQSLFWFGALSNANWSLKKASEYVQDYTREKIKELLQDFSVENDNGFLVCPECFEEYLPMAAAPSYYQVFDGKTRDKLKFCYLWFSGAIPPPSAAILKKWELVV